MRFNREYVTGNMKCICKECVDRRETSDVPKEKEAVVFCCKCGLVIPPFKIGCSAAPGNCHPIDKIC